MEVSLPALPSALGPGWEEINGGVMGEALIRGYLAVLDEGSSISAAAGWGGDRFSLFQGPSESMALVALSTWDIVEDAQEFLSALGSRPPDISHVEIVGVDVLFIIGPDDDVVGRLKAQVSGF